MNAHDIRSNLEALKDDPEFAYRSGELVEVWTAAGLGVEAIEPVLRFMESHPEIDYGTPGALVHFVERSHMRGYEQLLLDSIARRPTPHTAWMLNRLINGTRDDAVRRKYEEAMEQAAKHAAADPATVEQIRDFLDR